MTPADFFRANLENARRVSARTGIDPRLVLAQTALETGYGKSAPNNNLFGIKGQGSTQRTKEFRNGQMQSESANFRSYEDPAQSFDDYADLMLGSERYAGVLGAKGLENQISAMAKSGYATDPNYGQKLMSIASGIDLNSAGTIADDTMRAIGKSPKGILAPTQTSETETKPMMQQQKPRGLLERLGVQKMEEGAEGEAGQRFYNRESFGDTLANLAPALGRMGVMGLDVPAQAMANSRREDKLAKAATEKAKAQDNATGQWLIRNGFKAIGEGVLKGELSGAAGLQMSQVAKKPTKVATAIEEFEYAKVNENLPEGVTSLPEYKKYIARAGRNVPDVTMHPTLNRPLSPIEVSVDNEIAKTFGETVTTGLGAANRNAATIKSVLDRLGSTEEGEALTGPSKGMLGSFGRNVFAPTSQAALNDVSAVVQQSLREILGGQFAQKEGEQLIARAYDISAPPPVNAARLRALYTQLESIAANKAALIDYVEKYGTSAGFSGTTVTPSVDVFYNAMDRAVPQVGPEQGPLLPGQTYTDQELENAMANFSKSKGGVKQ